MEKDNLPQEQPILIASSKHRNLIDSDSEDQKVLQKIKDAKLYNSKPQLPTQMVAAAASRKRPPGEIESTAEKDKSMDIEVQHTRQLKFSELNQDIVFYLVDIYAFTGRLFITGLMQNGQTINIVALEPQKEIYFCLRSQYSEVDITSEALKAKAKREIDQRLYQSGISRFVSQFVDKEYVFEIEGVPRQRRPYYKVRYPFKLQVKEQPRPDWEGETFKFVFGTTYTPLQLFVMNSGIKGPSWVKVDKKFLSENTRNVESGICAQLQDPEFIEPVNQINKPPSLRVMSISIKAVIPSQLKLKKLFNTNRVEELHIYAISYYLCQQYMVEFKPNRYSGISRTFFLKQFGAQPKQKQFTVCDNQKQMIAQFQADIRKYDPDVLVCHDGSRILDTLIQRMIRISDKQDRPRLGRLVFTHDLSKSSQMQRINTTIAGRLLVDTFLHSKDMIKSVDYELESMVAHIRPQRVFKGMADEQILQYLNDSKTFHVIKKAKEQAECTFALMNHLEILQMTRQLSNICGNIWKRSLQNQRAERNQYLIMHDCVKRDLIIPDKFRKDKNSTEDDEETDRKKYQGGHVLDPQKGFYKDFILLLDFNSLYPSIIREYNVCFSVIDRPKLPMSYYYKNRDKKDKDKNIKKDENMEEQEIQVKPPAKEQCVKQKWGFLPQLIDKIVARRKNCKKAMKNASAEKVIMLDIQQKCYKLVANSIYGCLGFSISRFYSKHLAALITRMGRQALLRAKDIVDGMQGVKVIYGDTDSLMIQPIALDKEDDREKLFEINNIADELKKTINKQYSNLQIDVDGIFKPLILLMKKKYVARKLTNYDKIIARIDKNLDFNIQYKGIQVVRRDGFELGRKFLRRTLEILMDSTKQEPTQTYEEIYAYAKKVNQQFPTYSYKELLFSKQLNKPTKEYSRPETIPHVKVAMDMIKAGERQQTLINHTIYYIVCKPKDKSQDSLARVCFDGRAFERSQKFPGEQGPLEFDEDYYKRQLMQPVGRIIQHLPDFSVQRLLEQIGLSQQSRKKFKRQMESEKEEGEAILQGCISHSTTDKSNKLSEVLGEMQCRCGQKVLIADKGKFSVFCPNKTCSRSLVATIQNKIISMMKDRLQDYYMNRFKCRCGKEYNLNLLNQCCKIKYKPRSNIPFQIHEMVYVAKDMCSISLRDYPMNQQNADLHKKMGALNRKLDQFLQQSEFQKVEGLSHILNL